MDGLWLLGRDPVSLSAAAFLTGLVADWPAAADLCVLRPGRFLIALCTERHLIRRHRSCWEWPQRAAVSHMVWCGDAGRRLDVLVFLHAGCSLLGWTPPPPAPYCVPHGIFSQCVSFFPFEHELASFSLSSWLTQEQTRRTSWKTANRNISDIRVVHHSGEQKQAQPVCVCVSGGAEGAAWSLQTSNAEITHVITVIADFTSVDLRLRHQLSSLLSAGRLSSLCGDRRCSMQAIRQRNWITA